MKKSFIAAFVMLLVFMIVSCQAASYTLPEKMYNQLAIGSGLKGTFVITTEGEKFSSPFTDLITDAEFSLRGISSGKDLHYYLFQQNENEQQTAVNELYKKDGIYYFRSDMVQGKILSFPTLSQYLDSIMTTNRENITSSSFISGILGLTENEKKEKWDPVLLRYQNELELWLADFTVQADSVKMENGLSALDFTYEIPANEVTEQIVHLFGEFADDPEIAELLNTVMTAEEKMTYVNSNLLYYYRDALNSLNLNGPIRMNKRVSAMGELLRFKVELPLDERTTGYNSLGIEMIDQLTVYTLKSQKKILVLGLPGTNAFKSPSYELSVWYANIQTNTDENNEQNNQSVRADIIKTNEVYNDDSEKSHEINHYHVTIQQDTQYLPDEIDRSLLSAAETVQIDADLHYSSKYAQNSATTLEISAEILVDSSSAKINGKFKTAAPWLFMPFEIIDPIPAGTETKEVLEPYLIDWISNAPSMIHHLKDETSDDTDKTMQDAEVMQNNDSSMDINNQTQAEAVPLDETAPE